MVRSIEGGCVGEKGAWDTMIVGISFPNEEYTRVYHVPFQRNTTHNYSGLPSNHDATLKVHPSCCEYSLLFLVAHHKPSLIGDLQIWLIRCLLLIPLNAILTLILHKLGQIFSGNKLMGKFLENLQGTLNDVRKCKTHTLAILSK